MEGQTIGPSGNVDRLEGRRVDPGVGGDVELEVLEPLLGLVGQADVPAPHQRDLHAERRADPQGRGGVVRLLAKTPGHVELHLCGHGVHGEADRKEGLVDAVGNRRGEPGLQV